MHQSHRMLTATNAPLNHKDPFPEAELPRASNDNERKYIPKYSTISYNYIDMDVEPKRLISTVEALLAEKGVEREDAKSWAREVLVRLENRNVAPPLPEKAPALWAEDKQPGDTPPDFIMRHYAPWLGQGLTRADVHSLDQKLYTALANWLRTNKAPESFDLPTLKERNNRWMEQMRSAHTGGIDAPGGPTSFEDAERLSWAIRRRKSSAHRG